MAYRALKPLLIFIALVLPFGLKAQMGASDDEAIEENLNFEEFSEDVEDIGDMAEEVVDESNLQEVVEDEFTDFAEEVSEDDFADFAEEVTEEDFSDFEEVDSGAEEEFSNFDEEAQDFEDVAEPEQPIEENIEQEQELELVEEPQQELQEEPAKTFTETPEFVEKPVVDEPDKNLEAQLHQIYEDFHSAKTPAADWGEIVGNRATEEYDIHKGDTLWNISETLFGDGNYWPKIWSVNAEGITNPHLISPGNKVRFALGDESLPPIFTVTESNIDAETGSIVVNEIEVDIPPPLKSTTPVIRKLPPSFPEWQATKKLDKYDDLGIDYGKRPITEVIDKITLNFYVSGEAPLAYGTVREVEQGNRMASSYQYVFVAMEPDKSVQVGDRFGVVFNRGKVITNVPSPKAYSIEVQGEAQLVERVDDNGEMQVYRAVITKLVSPVTVGAKLVTDLVESVKIDSSGPHSQAVAQIIGGQYFNRRLVYGTDAIAYLNRGSDHGIKVGEIMPIRENRSMRKPDSIVKSNLRPIGWLQIIKTTPKLATALVLKSWSQVHMGDVTGAGNILDEERSRVMPGQTNVVDESKSLSELFDERSLPVESEVQEPSESPIEDLPKDVAEEVVEDQPVAEEVQVESFEEDFAEEGFSGEDFADEDFTDEDFSEGDFEDFSEEESSFE